MWLVVKKKNSRMSVSHGQRTLDPKSTFGEKLPRNPPGTGLHVSENIYFYDVKTPRFQSSSVTEE